MDLSQLCMQVRKKVFMHG